MDPLAVRVVRPYLTAIAASAAKGIGRMRQDQLDGLIAFVAVAQERGFSAAAARLGVSPSAISQSIRGLEQKLGLTLFNRTTRSVALTEVGARYLDRVLPSIQELLAANEALAEDADRPTGLVRLNVARSGFMIALQPILGRFLEAYPEVSLEVVIESHLADIVEAGFDAGIRFGDLVERDMVGVRIGPPLASQVIAAPDYFARRGVPRQPHDLLDHQCIAFRHVRSGLTKRWTFSKGAEQVQLAVPGRLIINDSAAMVQAALDGIGVAYMVNGYIERFVSQGRLVPVLTDWATPQDHLTLYYPDRQRVPLKLRVLIDFLRRAMPLATPEVDVFRAA